MKPILFYDQAELMFSDLGQEASVPSISNMINLQNKTKSTLDEDEGLYISYGNLSNSYPYKLRNTYNRECMKKKTSVAVLENDYLKATFLTSFGGRLWSLIDKTTGENLLYTNDVIRPSNLAVKNAWFSGGVEWNVGLIGHSPFTTEQMFVGELKTDEGYPVVRMYEFERIRKITYQMDFWLTEKSKYLVCRMRVCNDNNSLVPMYWWSNIAVPEFEGGRIIVPANQAFTHDNDGVKKVDTPKVNGIDISYYCNIPQAVDYFFDIKPQEVKFIANVNSNGYGLIQTSTSRLKGRKLFSWGHTQGSNNWQNYLTNNAGKYIEIQAGVERTQYGCVPMPPNTAWEWIELYGAIQTKNSFGNYSDAIDEVKQKLLSEIDYDELENILKTSKDGIAKKNAKLKQNGSGYGALENFRRSFSGIKSMAQHLDFGECLQEQEQWKKLLTQGYFDKMDVNLPPESFMCDEYWFDVLLKSIKSANLNNWYAHYQLGLMYINNLDYENALIHLHKSVEIEENCWAYHALAIIALNENQKDVASDYAYKSTLMLPNDLSLAKDCTKIILDCGAYDRLLSLIEKYPSKIANDTRIQMYKSLCFLKTGEVLKADKILNQNEGLEIADIREGEISITDLWCEIEAAKTGRPVNKKDIPLKFNFKATLD